METRSKTIVLFYGKHYYAKRRVDKRWKDFFLPKRTLSAYIKGAKDIDEDGDIRFVPSGKFAKLKDGVTAEIWEEATNG